jgi:hypothetical protein
MSPVPDDFEQLRRLLALKRYEQPPPGYFHSFSRQVIVRIKAGEPGDHTEASFWSFGDGSLLQRIWATLDARPVLAGAFGVAVCGFFVVGALLSDNGTATAATGEMPNTATMLVNAHAATPVWQQQKAASEFSSTVGVGLPNYQPPTGSLFEEIRNAQAPAQLGTTPQSGAATLIRASFHP